MAHRLSRGLLLASIVAATFAMQGRGAYAADPSIISVEPPAASANVGDDIPLDINAANIAESPGLGGYLLVLRWDPAVLTLTSITDSGWVTSGDAVVVCTTPTIDNGAGMAEADCTPVLSFGAGVSTSGPQALAHAVFEAKAAGTTAIDLTGSSLLNTSNVAITSTLTNGSVTVGAPSPATPTHTPSPGATSTAQPTRTPTPEQPANTPESRATPEPASTTLSTKPAQETLSKVEVPRTGSGTPASAERSGTAWWIPVLTAAGAALLGTGGLAAFRWARRRTDHG